MKQRLRIEVHGIVQGVGFRPYIYRLAKRFNLTGRIQNSENGVLIEVQGASEDTDAFLTALPSESPPLAQVHEIQTSLLAVEVEADFLILESTRTQKANTLVSPDIATCAECVRELFDPSNRRHLYPFLNCTNCGPRFTITRSVPYDRKNTSMAVFPMCDLCKAEYDDPLNRRFHAQPNACWECGPRATLVGRGGVAITGDPIEQAIRLLKEGCILAIKGLGGFHLAVNATDSEAVSELRRRKARGDEPFAAMVRDSAVADRFCYLSSEEIIAIELPQRPIVLLRKRNDLLDSLAPDGNQLGIFLPYTPLHHLLLGDPELFAVVMTSGNLSEEPIAIDNEEAQTRLGHIADYFLLHNRDILLRCDDSVVKVTAGPGDGSKQSRIQVLRRSRGFVPTPVRLYTSVPRILALGGELKNTICVSKDRYAFLGQHVGDLENLTAYDFFQESIKHFEDILEVTPQVIAHDLHPAYLTTRWAHEQRLGGTKIVGVQHHHAHIASCMSEHQLAGPVIGVALDGTGYGTDGCAWGGEVLVADFVGFERAAHLGYVPMPGGEKAIHEPWRMAISFLWNTFGSEWRKHTPSSFLRGIPDRSIQIVEQLLQAERGLTRSSSCGRLFDAVSAMVCCRSFASYEAQAAIALEAFCYPGSESGAYPFAIGESGADNRCLEIDSRPLFLALTEDMRNEVSPSVMSTRFHAGLVNVLGETVIRVARRVGMLDVCLSGGSFQNSILSQGLESWLTNAGFVVHQHQLVPPGDGGLSLGQLMVAANSSLT